MVESEGATNTHRFPGRCAVPACCIDQEVKESRGNPTGLETAVQTSLGGRRSGTVPLGVGTLSQGTGSSG